MDIASRCTLGGLGYQQKRRPGEVHHFNELREGNPPSRMFIIVRSAAKLKGIYVQGAKGFAKPEIVTCGAAAGELLRSWQKKERSLKLCQPPARPRAGPSAFCGHSSLVCLEAGNVLYCNGK